MAASIRWLPAKPHEIGHTMAQFSVRTRYVKPTDTKGSMIAVKNLHNDRTERYGYDHSVSDPHLTAVKASYPTATLIEETASNATGNVYRVTVPDIADLEIARAALGIYDRHDRIVVDGNELIGSAERAEWLISQLRPVVEREHRA